MRVTAIGALVAGLVVSSAASAAQQWINYVNPEYRFTVNFPVEPSEEESEHTSANGTVLAARTFYAEGENAIYRVTSVPFPQTVINVRAELEHVASLYRPRGEAWYDGGSDYDGIEAYEISMTAPDGRQILVSAVLHDRHLTIAEADVAAGAPPPIQFLHSITVIDIEGARINLEN